MIIRSSQLCYPLVIGFDEPVGGVIRRRRGGLDPDAAALITLVTAAKGSAPTATQQNAINVFFIAERESGRLAAYHRKFFLPIWGNAAANAICWITRASGTFVNSPTMGAGYVQGNGTTQRFDWGTSPAAMGMVTGSVMLWYLTKQAHSTTAYNIPTGATQSGKRIVRFERSNGNTTFGLDNNITGATSGVGISIGCEIADNSRYYRRRTSSGASSVGVDVGVLAGVFPTVNLTSMCANNGGAFSSFSDAQMGGYGGGLGMSTANADAFTANLKTLWETCTGLALP